VLDESVQSPVVIIRKTSPISLHSLNEFDLYSQLIRFNRSKLYSLKSLVQTSKKSVLGDASISFYCMEASVSIVFPDEIQLAGRLEISITQSDMFLSWLKILFFCWLCLAVRSRRNRRRDRAGGCPRLIEGICTVLWKLLTFIPMLLFKSASLLRRRIKLKQQLKLRREFYSAIIHVKSFKTDEISFNQDSCPICLDRFREEEPVHSLNCGHVFHARCLFHWFKDKEIAAMNCPLCAVNILSSNEQATNQLQVLGDDIQAQFIRDQLERAIPVHNESIIVDPNQTLPS
jgi:Ring finger domain